MKNKKLLSLYERVQFKQNVKANNSQYNYKFVGSNYTGLSVKETAKIIRKHLRQRFPEVKFSVRSNYDSIYLTIKSSPYERESQELKAIFDYCDKLLDSYNFDDSDPMIDYFHVHFYSIIQVAVDYVQTEQTPDVQKDIADFRQRLQQKQREDKAIQQEKQPLTEAQRQQFVNDSITAKDLLNGEQYFIRNCKFARLNKNNTLEEYREEVNSGDYDMQDVKITKEIYFKDKQTLEYFSNNLLNDFDFLKDTGGFDLNGNRLAVAIYYNNTLQFVVDTQGYSYARYVGLTDGSINEKNNNVIDITAKIQQKQEQESLKQDIEKFKNEYLPYLTENDLRVLLNTNKEKRGEELVKICMRIDLEKML